MLPRFFAPRTISKSITVLLCSSLLIAMLTPFGIAGGRRKAFLSNRVQESGPSPRAGAPEGSLPNLDEVKSQQLPQPVAPPSVPSTMRSRRNPLSPRIVRHVGDPLPSPSISPLPSPSILPSPSPLPSPSVSPLPSPLPSPSLLPSPSPLPSPSTTPLPSPSTTPLPLPLARAGSATPATAWINSGSGNEKLLPYLLAWNHSYPLPYQSSYSLSDLTGFNRNYSSLQLPSGERFERSADFDFYMVPMPQSGSTTRIVFTSNRDGRAQLYSMDASGGSLIRLTNNGANDDHPRWSPNGTKILFQSDRDNPETGT